MISSVWSGSGAQMIAPQRIDYHVLAEKIYIALGNTGMLAGQPEEVRARYERAAIMAANDVIQQVVGVVAAQGRDHQDAIRVQR